MASWADGYVAEIDYTFGYYAELNPARIPFALTMQGLMSPTIATACELGFGQGISTNIHAAASNVSWWGTDFNPSQAWFAKELSEYTGAKHFDQSFEEFCNRLDLPDFDFIALHGIWSWISNENRNIIVDFVRRKLRIGGVLYISYNTLPGWSTAAPLRHLLSEHKDTMTLKGLAILQRLQETITFVDNLFKLNPLWTKTNPLIEERYMQLKKQNHTYLTHEYFNRNWDPMYFSDIVKRFSDAKVSFAAPANYLEFLDNANLTVEQQSFLSDIADPNYRQSIRDYIVNQQFRKDYWIKGPRRLNIYEKENILKKQAVTLITRPEAIQLKARGALGEISLNEDVAKPILDYLADYKPRTLDEIAINCKNLNFTQILQTVTFLMGQGPIAPAQSSDIVSNSLFKSLRLNRAIIERARGSLDIGYLANPVIGGAIAVDRFQQLFLLSILNGNKDVSSIVNYVWNIVGSQGQKLVKNGAVIDSVDENILELKIQAEYFLEKVIPLLKMHSVIE